MKPVGRERILSRIPTFRKRQECVEQGSRLPREGQEARGPRAEESFRLVPGSIKLAATLLGALQRQLLAKRDGQVKQWPSQPRPRARTLLRRMPQDPWGRFRKGCC